MIIGLPMSYTLSLRRETASLIGWVLIVGFLAALAAVFCCKH